MRSRFYVQNAGNRYLSVTLDADSLVVTSMDEKRQMNLVNAEVKVKENVWTWIGVMETKRSMWRSTVSVWVNGECVKEDKMEYFEALEGYQVWFAHDQMENQAGVAEHE